MYTVKTTGGFNSIPMEDLDEAKEWANETNCSYTIVDDNGVIITTDQLELQRKLTQLDEWDCDQFDNSESYEFGDIPDDY
jgi:hypothetical protein